MNATKFAFASGILLAVSLSSAIPVDAQVCGRTDITMRLRLWIEMVDDPEGFLQGMPEYFADVVVDGVLVCNDLGLGNGSSANDGPLDCLFDIAPPYDPITVEIWVLEDDELFGGTRDIIDVSSDDRAKIVFQYNPQCNRLISTNPEMFGGECYGSFASVPDSCTGHTRTSVGDRRPDYDRARVRFEIGTADGLPTMTNDLQLTGLEVIQVVPNARALVADKDTMVRYTVASSHHGTISATVQARLVDKMGTEFLEEQIIDLNECEPRRIDFFTFGIKPQDGPLNNPVVEGRVDPYLEYDCTTEACQGERDCRILNNLDQITEIPLREARDFRVMYAPLPADPFGCLHTTVGLADLNATADLADPMIKDLFPITNITSIRTPEYVGWDPFNVIPQVGIVEYDLGHRLSGIDRIVGVGSQDYFDCHFWSPWSGRGGASAGEFGRSLVLVESEATAPEGQTVVHELGHTYDLSEAPCPDSITWPDSAWECEDEYNWTASGNPTRGYWIRGGQDTDGWSCIMGASPPGPLSQWIEEVDYSRLLDWLTGRIPEEVVWMLLTVDRVGLTGSIERSTISSTLLVPDRLPPSRGGIPRGEGSASLDFYDGAGTFLDSVDFIPEFWDELGRMTLSFPEDDRERDSKTLALTVPLPAGAARVDFIRRSDTSGATDVLVDSVAFFAEPFVADLIFPTIPVPVSPGDRVPIRWGSSLLPPFAGGEAGTLDRPTMAIIMISPDNGGTWIPIAQRVQGNEYLWEARSTGRYLVRVFLTNGFDTSEAQGLIDTDFDGCPNVTDPDPKNPNPDTLDGDGIADICDNCPTIPNPVQEDPDGDFYGSACDNCPEVTNGQQSDIDNDGWGDVCDCQPQDGSAFAVPGQVAGLVLGKNSVNPETDVDLIWDSLAPTSGSGTGYDVVAGDLSAIGPNGLLPDECTANDLPSPGVTASRALEPGFGIWYLIRGQNSCGHGSWDGGGTGQVVPRDPGLGGVCP